MADISPPPTYADPVLVDKQSGEAQFNPLWLSWFLQLAQYINSAGGTQITDNHQELSELQGGDADDRYHLTSPAAHAVETYYTDFGGITNGLPLSGGTMTGPIVMAGGDTTVAPAASDSSAKLVTSAWVRENLVANEVAGSTTGANPYGFLGELQAAYNSSSGLSLSTTHVVGTLTLTPGVWLVWAVSYFQFSATGNTAYYVRAEVVDTGTAYSVQATQIELAAGGPTQTIMAAPKVFQTSTAITIDLLSDASNTAGGTFSSQCYIQALRVG